MTSMAGISDIEAGDGAFQFIQGNRVLDADDFCLCRVGQEGMGNGHFNGILIAVGV